MSATLDYLPEALPATDLYWPGASAEQLDFMRAVYEAHVARSAARHSFVPDVDPAELAPIEGRFLARTAAATACQGLLAAARAASRGQGLPITVGLTSAYRPASQQLRIWQDNFPTYYQETRDLRRHLAGGAHGAEATQRLAAYVGQRVGAPGFSNHNNGLAIDLGVQENGVRIQNRTQPPHTARWRQTWLWSWLTTNAARFGYYQNTHIDEPWHWEYRPASPPVVTEATAEATEIAAELLHAAQAGRVSLGGVQQQVKQLAQTGSITSGDTTTELSDNLLALLQALLAATPQPAGGQRPPFELLSLVRPRPKKKTARIGKHPLGRAVDISRFAGFDIVMTNPGRALQGVLAVIGALPAGTYALGLPRPVRADAIGADTDNRNYPQLGLYQPGPPPTLKPQYQDLPAQNVFLPVRDETDINKSPTGSVTRDLALIVDATAQTLLRQAVAEARQRGAIIRFLFPDALNHLHVHIED